VLLLVLGRCRGSFVHASSVSIAVVCRCRRDGAPCVVAPLCRAALHDGAPEAAVIAHARGRREAVWAAAKRCAACGSSQRHRTTAVLQWRAVQPPLGPWRGSIASAPPGRCCLERAAFRDGHASARSELPFAGRGSPAGPAAAGSLASAPRLSPAGCRNVAALRWPTLLVPVRLVGRKCRRASNHV
jgi:hypothetical protein